MVNVHKCDSNFNKETLHRLQMKETFLRDMKRYLEAQLFEVQIVELSLKSTCRNKRIKVEKIKLEEEARAEKFMQEMKVNTEDKNAIKMTSIPRNMENDLPGTSMPSSDSFVQSLEPIELTSTGFEEISIDSEDDDAIF